MAYIDLNCDMGEGSGNDAFIMPWISSANIACGYHAGDEDTMKRTIELAMQHGVAIGAHPSFDDKKNFGRTEMQVEASHLYDLIATQVHILKNITNAAGTSLHHVKPHGALYNMAAKDAMLSLTIARAVKDVDASLALYGLSNSLLVKEAAKLGLFTASEVFADRTYTDEGTLTPRSDPNALIEDTGHAIKQVIRMIIKQEVISASGKEINIQADTVCIHGDGKHAVEFAKRIHQSLKEKNIAIKSCR